MLLIRTESIGSSEWRSHITSNNYPTLVSYSWLREQFFLNIGIKCSLTHVFQIFLLYKVVDMG